MMRFNTKTLIVVLLSILALTALAFGAYELKITASLYRQKKTTTPCDKAM